MKTAKQLKDKYEKDIKHLQETCKHEKISDWLVARDFHGNEMNEVKQCEICWMYISRRINCSVCKNDFVILEKEYRTWDQLCPECSKKERHYCFTHNEFYNGLYGCSKCLKFLESVEKIKGKERGKK